MTFSVSPSKCINHSQQIPSPSPSKIDTVFIPTSPSNPLQILFKTHLPSPSTPSKLPFLSSSFSLTNPVWSGTSHKERYETKGNISIASRINMGNYVSCTLSTPLGKSSKSTKVILPSGEIRQFNEPVKAAELMLETPNFFLVNSQSLKLGRRFSPLNADEDLEFANVYVMFPMKRLNSTVTAADMGALFVAANSAAKKGGEVRILPEAAEEANLRDVLLENEQKKAMVPKLNLDDIEEFSIPEFMHRVSMSRSKKPLLETIAEEPVRARGGFNRENHREMIYSVLKVSYDVSTCAIIRKL